MLYPCREDNCLSLTPWNRKIGSEHILKILGKRRIPQHVKFDNSDDLIGFTAAEPESVKKNIEYVAEYGRFDDLLALMGTPVEKEALDYIEKIFRADCENLAEGGENAEVSLLAKWLPSVNTSNKKAVMDAKKIARAMAMTDV